MKPSAENPAPLFLFSLACSTAGVIGGVLFYRWSGWGGAAFFLCLLLTCSAAAAAGVCAVRCRPGGEKGSPSPNTGAPGSAFSGRASAGAGHPPEARLSALLASGSVKRGALILVELEGFGRRIGRLGEGAGDAVRGELAARLRCVFPGAVLAEWVGGERLLLFTDRLAGPASLSRCLAELLGCFRRQGIDAAAGAAHFPRDGGTAASLRQKAEAALCRAKKAGKNRWCLYPGDGR